MLSNFKCSCPVYLAYGYTDLRRGIDGLAGLVQTQFQLDPFQNALFLFCGQRKIICCRCMKNCTGSW